MYNQKLLNSMSAVEETAHVRRVRFSAPIVMKIDGMKKIPCLLIAKTVAEATCEVL